MIIKRDVVFTLESCGQDLDAWARVSLETSEDDRAGEIFEIITGSFISVNDCDMPLSVAKMLFCSEDHLEDKAREALNETLEEEGRQ